MQATVTFFPVDNGDMTLITLADPQGTNILVDCNIRQAADDPDEKDYRDVARDLRSRIKRTANGRPYVEAFLLSHPDEDHCRGLKRHFYLGPLADYPDDNKPEAEKRILILEMWSSPMVFRRRCASHALCADAEAFNNEARRRVALNREKNFAVGDGDRILVLGEDKDGKTDDLGQILVKAGQQLQRINGQVSRYFRGHLLAPRHLEDPETEELLSKNESSVIFNFKLADSADDFTACSFLTGGDAEVAIWERIWQRYKTTPEVLQYDILQTPHHCSWRSLSAESWSESKGKAQVSKDARSALAQAKNGALIIASSKPISADDCDPPCTGSVAQYKAIAAAANGRFYCTAEYPSLKFPAPLTLKITQQGPILLVASGAAVAATSSQRAGRAG